MPAETVDALRLDSIEAIETWLKEDRPEHLALLFEAADRMRRERVGDAVHLRGLIEISNHCVRACTYCGLRAANRSVQRFRLSAAQLLECARTAARLGYGSVVMQGGEDYGIEAPWLAEVIRSIKAELEVAVTLSLGERPHAELRLWREAGADRYLLRHETCDRALYERIHPRWAGRPSDRLALLEDLRRLGYEIGSGVMIGIPGQSYASLAKDIDIFRRMDLDMVGVGPYIPHPDTPLHGEQADLRLPPADQVPATPEMTYKVLALTRLACPEANVPSTTALATLDPAKGRDLGLQRGANVVMPNVTPPEERSAYRIYPDKDCPEETVEMCEDHLPERLAAIGRTMGRGQGSRQRG